MVDVRIHQIHYDDRSRAALDTGFIPLDNSGNERPDWREYHPIRSFLLGRELDRDAFYGFLSPEFSRKSGLASEQVKAFVAGNASAEVLLFCPFFDQSAFFLNVFEQGEFHHSGMIRAGQEFVDAAGSAIDLPSMVNNSTNTIFSNYFVARPRFWAEWLRLGEKLYECCEAGKLPSLTNATAYKDARDVELKVFLMERLATLVLATGGGFETVTYDPTILPMSMSPLSRFRKEAVMCDALKMAYRKHGNRAYLDEFFAIRNRLRSKAEWSRSAFSFLMRRRAQTSKA